MAEWPELSDELARKSLTTLENLAFKHDAGDLTKGEFWVAIDAMCDLIQGLVPAEVFDAIYAVRQSLGKRKQ